jgi:hypothetical protein
MVIKFVRTNPDLGVVAGTARYLSIVTTPATQIVMTSGSQAMTIFNIGSGTLIWGDSSIAVNSGNNLFVQARVEWLNLQDGWSLYVRAESVATLISVTEYRV